MSSYAVPGSSKSDSSVTESGTASTVSVPQQSSTKSPQPGTSNKNSSNDCNNQQETESFVIVNAADLDHNNINQDDPKPGPSTTAAEFDLEVFDSGSSCSLEDCWRCDKDCPPVNAPVQGLFYVLDLDTGFEFEIRGIFVSVV